jgi:hypothetical protein
MRFLLMATHTYDQVNEAIEKITTVANKLDVLAAVTVKSE